ncbi:MULTISPECIES: WecB/TagA/CpsF family glycosyltransferase [unclassified Mesorhizobium]|uniref:WecB/TagA/CpsF family glycosyltransferase n=1 Tax=unclassified Mesorhizobium TaxID=325217 RepID=UPI000FDB1A90|nr:MULTISPECIES: WecB/TagA/CpsF family glycosyltransferase [unclassified Mesorhizobium]TGQ42056.1 glycosyltransferase [Mesorhizobium sp. M00.F.Ca.ET.216.01.1.1]TIS55090.1 MAG: WecB/TagA/CpsF family glycosyltransferase [Mesorhizobium sp.]TIS92918.1 MAG: WecB/TagA/CpsF family glycosyltransferase [Mesorhizobium sp.]TJW14898.1 MAG: WecB/TagA/CpsF family glycosyltransferase [Mesorhizobium sp.]TJW48952.1 MAG: WecB/TagA/CpsF family glycosyltransferase [Mesorhizobium sp.]
MSAHDLAWAQHSLLASRRREFLGTPIHALTMAETLAIADEAMSLRRPLHHVVVNVAKLVNMRKNNELREDVATADVINVDGKGVLWGARLCGIALPERVAGVDIMVNLLRLCARRGYRPFLLGAEQHVLDAVKGRLASDYPSLVIAGMRDGYFKPEDEPAIVEMINASGADCLLVAMPTPRKERFLKRYRDELAPSFVMGVGGSFDVYGGKVARAPKLVQAAGLEWLFRVAQEPRRLWRRYYDTNTAYAALLWREFWNRQRRNVDL